VFLDMFDIYCIIFRSNIYIFQIKIP